jgi:nucleoside-triphosphatase THEP1
MEFLSPQFGEVAQELLDGPALVVGTIVRRRHPLADRVKAHPRVKLVEVTPANRDQLPAELFAELRRYQASLE